MKNMQSQLSKKNEWVKEPFTQEEIERKMYNLTELEWFKYTEIFSKLMYSKSDEYESKNERIKRLLLKNWSLTIIPVVAVICLLFNQIVALIAYLAVSIYYNYFHVKLIRCDEADIATFYILNYQDAHKYVKHHVLVSDLELKALLKEDDTNVALRAHEIKTTYINALLENNPYLEESEADENLVETDTSIE